jgi:hypothetical protein
MTCSSLSAYRWESRRQTFRWVTICWRSCPPSLSCHTFPGDIFSTCAAWHPLFCGLQVESMLLVRLKCVSHARFLSAGKCGSLQLLSVHQRFITASIYLLSIQAFSSQSVNGTHDLNWLPFLHTQRNGGPSRVHKKFPKPATCRRSKASLACVHASQEKGTG